MPQPSPSLQPPNAEAVGTDPAALPAVTPRYQVVGLTPADTMPIDFAGRVFDLAALSDEDLAFLRQYPDQVPYLA